jgi:hypothetical protein
MGSARTLTHSRNEAPRHRSRGASSDPNRIRVPTAAERDELTEYLRLCGWEVEPVGKRDLRAHHPRQNGDDLVSLRFSIAVWRGLDDCAQLLSRFAT